MKWKSTLFFFSCQYRDFYIVNGNHGIDMVKSPKRMKRVNKCRTEVGQTQLYCAPEKGGTELYWPAEIDNQEQPYY